MKRLALFFVVLVALAIVVGGCTGLQINDDAGTMALVKSASRTLGFVVAKHGNEKAQVLISTVFNYVKSGELDPTYLNLTLQQFKGETMHPLILPSVLDLLGVLGASVNMGTITSLPDIPVELLDAAEQSYKMGLILGVDPHRSAK